jgi:segregation and condensation protein B
MLCLSMSFKEPEPFIEALIFASEKSISAEEIQQVLAELSEEEQISIAAINALIEQIRQKYLDLNLAIELVQLNGGYQFLTRKEFYPVINQLQIQRSKKKLSQAALETLSIIAYKQPVTKLEIEQIRGVNCDYTVQKLLEKELISIAGKSETVGKPLLYATSGLFMDYFGINSTKDLPQITELVSESNIIGDQSE